MKIIFTFSSILKFLVITKISIMQFYSIMNHNKFQMAVCTFTYKDIITFKICFNNFTVNYYLQQFKLVELQIIMFGNHHTYDMKPSGKKMIGLQGQRANQWQLGWDNGASNQNTNNRVDRIGLSKKKQVEIKLNYVPPTRNQQPFQQRNIQNQYDEGQVLSYLRAYPEITQMPQDKLQKVMKYYENLKKIQTSQPQTVAKVGYQNTIQKRQPIIPKQSAGGIIYGNSHQQQGKQATRYSERNKSTLKLGSDYNYFKEDQPIKPKNISKQQRIPPTIKSSNQNKRISNIQFG